MPPEAIASEGALDDRRGDSLDAVARHGRASSRSSRRGWGNLGADPKPPSRGSKIDAERGRRPRPRARRLAGPAPLGARAGCRSAARAGSRRPRRGRRAWLVDLVATVAPRPRRSRRAPGGRTASRGGHGRGSTCRRRKGRPSGVAKTVIGQPPRAGGRLHRLHVDGVDVGTFLAVDLHAHEVLRSSPRPSPGRRRTRDPSRGTSGTPSSRSRRTEGRSSSFAASRGPRRPRGTSRPGSAACWRR